MKIIGSTALVAVGIMLVSTSARADAAESSPPRAEETTAPSDEDTDALRIGVLGGVGFPRPLAVEGLIKIDRVVALGIEYSALPKTTFGPVETSLWAVAADARLFPFRNGFFIGLRGGRQVLSAAGSVSLASFGTFEQSARAETWFVNPRIGFLWTWRSGLTIGIDAGVQLPLSSSITSTLPAGLPPQVDATIASVAGTLGSNVTPTVDLLRVGFLF